MSSRPARQLPPDVSALNGLSPLLAAFYKEADLEDLWKRSQRIIDQYNQFEVLPGVHVKGENTIGENIADLGGVSAAHLKVADHSQRFWALVGRHCPDWRAQARWLRRNGSALTLAL